jgi:ssDNA-binding Zn-finger/Zn-ribbon topoisomerase 1
LVEKINAILQGQGDAIVQRIEREGGKVVLYGYEPQPVFDAVNEIVGPSNWFFEPVGEPDLKAIQTSSGKDQVRAIVHVKVVFRHPWLETILYGSGSCIMNIREPGDAINGAATRAIQKAFSRIGIGRHAYRGELGEPSDNGTPQTTKGTRPAAPPAPKDAPAQPKVPAGLTCTRCGKTMKSFTSKDGRSWLSCPARDRIRKGNDWVDPPDRKEHDFYPAPAAEPEPPEDETPWPDDLPFEGPPAERPIEPGICEACGLDLVEIVAPNNSGYRCCPLIRPKVRWRVTQTGQVATFWVEGGRFGHTVGPV